jgi:hypothetical protein
VIGALIKALREGLDALVGCLHRLGGADRRRQFAMQTGPAGSSRFAVLCAHDLTPRPDLRQLLATLRRAGFYCVVVSGNGAFAQYAGLADATLAIGSYGRDFTAYKAGFEFLDPRVPTARSTILFFNDSAWYFEKGQAGLVDRLVASTEADELCAGGLIADEVPHVTGWLFAVPFDADWRPSLSTLFQPDFVRRSRDYHIRVGEHRILPSMTRAKAVRRLQEAGPNPAVAACYSALQAGLACFYLKSDAQLRTDPPTNRLAAFLEVNAGPQEQTDALRWLAARSAALLADRIHARDVVLYRKRHFGGT